MFLHVIIYTLIPIYLSIVALNLTNDSRFLWIFEQVRESDEENSRYTRNRSSIVGHKVNECFVVEGHSIPVESFGRIQLWGDLMQIRRVDAQDAGRYICRASNQVGEQRAETHLSVTSKLNARIQPRVQVGVWIII